MSMNILKKIYFLISLSGEGRIIIYFILLLIGTIFELLSIGLIFPFITLALGSELPDNLIFIDKFLSLISYTLSISYLIAAIIFLLSIFIIKNIFLIYYNWWKFGFSNVVQLDLSQRLFSFYLSRPLIFHLQKNSSIMIRNLISEISQVQKILILVLNFFFEFIVFISILSMLIITEPMAALLSITILGTSSVIYFLLTKKKISQWGKIRLKQSGKYLKNITQSINSIKEIIVTGRIKLFLDIHYNQRKTLASIMQKFGITDIIPKYLFEILAILSFSAVILFFSKQEKSYVEIFPLIGLFVMAVYRLMPSVARMLGAIQSIIYKSPTIDNLYDELRYQKKEVKDFDFFFKFQENITDRYFFRDKIEIKNLIYYFASSKNKILDHVSFTINKGDMVGIVGDSGSGKSTLINLLMGLLTTDEEFIFVDDQPIKKILNIWHNDIGYVAQSPYMADETIRNNIGFGIPENMIDDDKIDRAIEFSQLKKFILSKSKGINTRVGETGSNISGGQLQRIALARAVYHDPSILIFDEPTSALDSNTEAQIIKDLKKMKGNKTIILVSHKKSTLQYCDQIIEIKKGKVTNIKYNKLR
jgi:ABC-type multidrug transport system fused ATPase/permease subunit